ncbi:MAG: 2-oxo acid dehydrogenase subunit E2 [Actinobacteria bacterium]|nr:2-oxo acid dehydrogenase subunit E2 [Actinomycetota bacterium]
MSAAGEPRRVPFTGLRGAVARAMTAAWQAPRVAAAVEVDMRPCLALQRELQERVGAEPRLTPTHLVLRAVALTLREHPRLNGRVDAEGVELVEEVALGLAVNLDEGLLVPVIRDAGEKPVEQLARESRELAGAARAGRLGPSAIKHGTFTVSTLGATGIDWFTPVLNAPQVAILGVGRIAERPLVQDGAVIAAPTMALTLVYDHRAVDGHPASLMLAALRDRLERADFA